MNKKDLGLLVLILVVGLFVYLRNPLFLSPNNLANTANLIGLFGLFSIAQGFVIITGGIELSVGSMIALLGVLFVDMVGRLGVPWPIAAAIVMVLGLALGLAHGLLITKLRMQPFVVTLCGLLIYRGVSRGYTADATAGFPFGSTYPGTRFLRRPALRHSDLGLRAGRGRDHRLDRAAPVGVRPLPLCGRQERGGGALFRHSHRPRRHRGLCDLRRH